LPRAMASLCSWAARRLAWRESPARSHGVAELLAGGPAEVGVGGLAGLAGGGGDSGQADQRFGGREPGPAVTGPGGQPCGPDGAPSS
jgi:hypothetical protein